MTDWSLSVMRFYTKDGNKRHAIKLKQEKTLRLAAEQVSLIPPHLEKLNPCLDSSSHFLKLIKIALDELPRGNNLEFLMRTA